jgi:hypothetical protein
MEYDSQYLLIEKKFITLLYYIIFGGIFAFIFVKCR